MIATRANAPTTPHIDGFGAIIPSSMTPETMLLAKPLICAVATAVVATSVATELNKYFIHAKV